MSTTTLIDARQSPPRRDYAWLTVAGLLLFMAILARVGMLAWPFYSDSGSFVMMGRTVARGEMLYRDFYETKLPGVGLLMSALWRAFGAWWPGYIFTQIAMALLAAAALGRAAGRTIGSAARGPTFLFAAVYLNFSWVVYTGFQLETMQCFFAALAAAAAMEALAGDSLADAFTAGLAAGCAAMVKPSGLAPVAAFCIALMLGATPWRRRGAHVACVIAGVAVPTGITAIYAWQTGVWRYVPWVLRQIALYTSTTPITALEVFGKLLVAAVLIGYPIAVRGWVLRRSPRLAGTSDLRLRRQLTLFAVAWLLAEGAGIVLQWRMYFYHFLPLACPAALLYGLVPRKDRAVSMAFCLLPVALLSQMWETSNLSLLPGSTGPSQVSQYVMSHTKPGDSVFANQISRLLIESDRQPGTRYGIFFYWANYDTAAIDIWRIMQSDFDQRKPVYILLPTNADSAINTMTHETEAAANSVRQQNCQAAWKDFKSYLAKNYRWETTIDHTDIYRRRPDVGSLANLPTEAP